MSKKWQQTSRQCAEKRQADARARVQKDASEQAVREQQAREALSAKFPSLLGSIEAASHGKASGPHGVFLTNMFGSCRNRAHLDRYMRLYARLQKTCPRLGTRDDYLKPLWGVCQFDWVRPLDTWRPRGKAPEALFRSLVAHELATYPVPQFLYSAFIMDSTLADTQSWSGHLKPLDLFVHLAQRGSMKDAMKHGLLSAQMTARMCHLFLHSAAHLSLLEAIRHAQVKALGGPPWLAEALCDTPVRRGDLQDNKAESFWLTVIQWLCTVGIADGTQVGPLIDYIAARWHQDRSFAIKGRSHQAMLRAMEAWHRELHRAPVPGAHVYRPSGFHPGIWDYGSEWHRICWTMEEILTANALRQEGGLCITVWRHMVMRCKAVGPRSGVFAAATSAV